MSSYRSRLRQLKPVWGWATDGLWALALLGLPLTTFPLIFRQTLAVVSPFTALPVYALIVVWFVPYLFVKRGGLPRESTPFLAFILAALAASALAFFIEIPVYKGKHFFEQEIRSWVTLLTGLAIYLIFASYPQTEKRLVRSFQWIHLGGILLILWTSFQAYYMLIEQPYPTWFIRISDLVVRKHADFRSSGSRVTGLAYEPSWFAHQMVMLYLPALLAASYARISAFRFRLFHLSVENLLLLPAGVLFFLSAPRISLASLMFMLVYLFWLANAALFKRLLSGVSSRFSKRGNQLIPLRLAASVVLVLLFIGLYSSLLTGAAYLASQRDWRVQLLFEQPPSLTDIVRAASLDEMSLLRISHRLAFLERMVYWMSGWHVFNQYPWFGAGLGNAGFYALQTTPAMGWASYEIRQYLLHWDQLPNVKSFWVRLLAETGLVGFVIFAAWLFLLWRSAAVTRRSDSVPLRLAALTGQLAILAFIGEGFSIDSFTMPYLWVGLGFISASGFVFRRRLRARAPVAVFIESRPSPAEGMA